MLRHRPAMLALFVGVFLALSDRPLGAEDTVAPGGQVTRLDLFGPQPQLAAGVLLSVLTQAPLPGGEFQPAIRPDPAICEIRE